MVLGKLPVPGRPTIWITVEQGPTALAVGAGGGCLDIFILIYPFSPLSPSLWETARYRHKYCLKGPLSPGVVRCCWANFQCRGVLQFGYSRARAYCARSRCGWGFGHFYPIYPFFPLSPSLWETARYRLKYCLKGPLNPKQPTNQPLSPKQPTNQLGS